VPLAALFTLITLAFAAIAVYSATASQWPIAVASGALAAWMGSLAYSALRKTRV
jgi:membrane associated rhomboid family serine protease